jgi:hypothetical protein
MGKWTSTVFFILLAGRAVFGGAVVLAQVPPANQPDMVLDARTRAEAIHALVDDLQKIYVFPDLGDRVAAMLAGRLKRGEYDGITSAKAFSELLTNQMREIAHDAHLGVSYSALAFPPAPDSSGAPPQQFPPEMMLRLKKDNFGFQEVRRLDGNVGYLKITGFVSATLDGDTVAGAMAFLANTDALIIDLRDNVGGNPTTVALLATYFFGAEPVHLNDIEWRQEGSKDYRLEQWWTLPYVPGHRYLDKEVYILTSRATPSAAEELTYDLKALKRAIVVGETTWGGANPGAGHRLGDHFMAFIPAGHAINPITRTNWEGLGVEPDLKTSAADAFDAAYRTALQHLVEKTTDPRDLNVLKQALGKRAGAAGK